jgi:ATP synthase in type III secretion protein N
MSSRAPLAHALPGAPSGSGDLPLGAEDPHRFSHALLGALARTQAVQVIGRVSEAYGTLIKATGLTARIGEVCLLRDAAGSWELKAEVVGLSKSQLLLTPLGNLAGIGAGTEVTPSGHRFEVPAGRACLGRVLDAHGAPLDDLGPLRAEAFVPVHAAPSNPLKRPLIQRPLGSGVMAIDCLLTCGEGQRTGIFSSAGAGKSTLMGMLARGSSADINVVALVGERGREVNEFIADNLGPEGMKKSVVVVATSDRPAMERARAAHVATALAEYFRDQGKRVLLLVDSITRFARALRDIGLSVGEPPTRRGYPPSVFTALPALFERAGTNERGSITAFYSVLLEDEELGDPIAEEVRSLLDGHIYLSRKLANAHHYPAIDVLGSVSRVMSRVVTQEHLQQAGRLRNLVAKHQELELLIQLGEYKPGGDPEGDEAIRRIESIRALLRQDAAQLVSLNTAVQALREALN